LVWISILLDMVAPRPLTRRKVLLLSMGICVGTTPLNTMCTPVKGFPLNWLFRLHLEIEVVVCFVHHIENVLKVEEVVVRVLNFYLLGLSDILD